MYWLACDCAARHGPVHAIDTLVAKTPSFGPTIHLRDSRQMQALGEVVNLLSLYRNRRNVTELGVLRVGMANITISIHSLAILS
jgi:hypothetical protein